MLNGSFDCRIKFYRRHEIIPHTTFKLRSGAEFLHSDAADWEFFATYFTDNIQGGCAAYAYGIGNANRLILSAQEEEITSTN